MPAEVSSQSLFLFICDEKAGNRIKNSANPFPFTISSRGSRTEKRSLRKATQFLSAITRFNYFFLLKPIGLVFFFFFRIS